MKQEPDVIRFENVTLLYRSEPKTRFAPVDERDEDEDFDEEVEDDVSQDELLLHDITRGFTAGSVYGIESLSAEHSASILDLVAGARRPSAGRVTRQGRTIALHRHRSFLKGVTGGLSSRILVEMLFAFSGYTRRQIGLALIAAAKTLDLPHPSLRRPLTELGETGFGRLCIHTALALEPAILLLADSMVSKIAAEEDLTVLTKRGMTVLVGCRSARGTRMPVDEALVLENGRLAERSPPTPTLPGFPEAPEARLEKTEVKEQADVFEMKIVYRALQAFEITAITVRIGSRGMLLSRGVYHQASSFTAGDRFAVTLRLAHDIFLERDYGVHLGFELICSGKRSEMSLDLKLPATVEGGPIEMEPYWPLGSKQKPLVELPVCCVLRRVGDEEA